MTMDVGQFRFPVSLYVPSTTKDDAGQAIHSFTRSHTLFCHVKDVRGKLTDAGEQEMSGRRTALFTMRYDQKVEYGCRLEYQGAMYSIERVDRADQRNRFLLVYAFEVDQ